MLIRLNKYLADQGVASRRQADELIKQGLVKVDGKIIKELGTKIDSEKNRVEISQKVLDDKKNLVYLVLNKPTGYTTSSKPTAADPKIVLELVPNNPRIFPVGRLDKDSSGLLIFTNDGVLAYRLTHPKFECEKEYEITLSAPLTRERIRKIEAGVKLEYTKTNPTRVIPLAEKKARIVITEGRNRQVRKIFGKVGCEVLTLKRIRIKNLTLGNLAPGKWRALTNTEVQTLIR